MRKKLITFLTILIFGANPVFAFAQSTTPATSPTATTAPTKSSVKDAMKQARQDFKDQMSQAREDFKAKLAQIKDQRKQTILANFDAKVNEINTTRTGQMSEHLERLQKVLDKISTKAAALKSQGQNTTTVEADIASAQTAIDAAKQAVTDQAAKDYVALINPNTPKTGASAVMRQYVSDIRAALQKVMTARNAVRKAFTDMAKLMGDKVSPTQTVSTTPVPSVTVTPTP